MTALDDARAALAPLEAHPFLDDTTAAWVRVERRDALAIRNALRALIADRERLTTPPTDDESEALPVVIRKALHEAQVVPNESLVDHLVDRVSAAGFRLPGPITDAESMLLAVDEVACFICNGPRPDGYVALLERIEASRSAS